MFTTWENAPASCEICCREHSYSPPFFFLLFYCIGGMSGPGLRSVPCRALQKRGIVFNSVRSIGKERALARHTTFSPPFRPLAAKKNPNSTIAMALGDAKFIMEGPRSRQRSSVLASINTMGFAHTRRYFFSSRGVASTIEFSGTEVPSTAFAVSTMGVSAHATREMEERSCFAFSLIPYSPMHVFVAAGINLLH